MKPSLWLRMASVLTLVLAAGHTTGFPWTPDQGVRSVLLVNQMKSHHFEVMGFTRSYWDFYLGFGLTIGVALLLLAVWFWQLAGMAKTEPQRARPYVAVLLAGFAALALLDWGYFFTPPLALTIAIVFCLALSVALGGRAPSARTSDPRG
jgi:hypothetical protein